MRISRLPGGRRGGVALLAVVLFGIAAGSIAYAAIPGGDGLIHACYQKASGSLHVIGTNPTVGGGSCSSGEQPLSWNQVGKVGATGRTGPTGPTGPTGVSGYEVVSKFVTGTAQEVDGEALCPSGKVALGGGASISGLINNSNNGHDGLGPDLIASDIDTVNNGWAAAAFAEASYAGQFDLTIHVVCAKTT